MNQVLVRVQNAKKTYVTGDQAVEAVKGVSLEIKTGELICVMGPSGSGKSTLLHLLGGLDRPTGGKIEISGVSLDAMPDRDLSDFRRDRLGFIFQFFNLLPTLTAEENVALPALMGKIPLSRIQPKIHSLLDKMGIAGRKGHYPSQLSGGEMQRVAIARALINDPLLILADEPTGNLDSKNGHVVLELLRELVRERNQTLIMVTHDPVAASYGTRMIRLRDGFIESDERGSKA